MSLSPDDFLKQLEELGVLAADQSKTFQEGVSLDAFPKDIEGLAQELVRQGKLTEFQAEEAARGNARSLVLGNYVLLEKIGAGGMGQVFKARHQVMDRVVAVKILPAALTKDKAAISRFHREVKAAAKISHPNIVTAHDADQADGVHFLVMEYVEGCDLSALVRKNGPLSVERAVNFTLQAARGLEAAHKKGIVHRDIKPANLLLDSVGVVKILDMGLARIDQTDGPAQEELTNTGIIMGTVDYMAPEQALDTKTADARADIYALGCSLLFMLTGKSAYQGDSLMKKLLAHREQPIPSLRAIRPEIPEPLEAVFRKMLAKKVEDRYQTMGEVIAGLGRCSGVPDSSLTIRDSASLHIERSVTQKVSSELSFEQTMLSAAVEPVTSESVKSAPVTTVNPPGTSKKKPLLIGGGIAGIALLAVIIFAITNKGGTKSGNEVRDAAKVETTNPPDGASALLAFQKPGFDAWVKEVQTLPAEQQSEAVSKKLMELNPGFDGEIKAGHRGDGSPWIENGVVIEVGFFTDNVTDISPVRAFAGLAVLCVQGSSVGRGKLQDLSPLKAMRLTKFVCRNNPELSDLAPLKDLRLTILDCPNTGVSDLSPITAMKLNSLSVGITKVVDLLPLKGMPLENLEIGATKVSDLSPLHGMRLQTLIMQNSPAGDLSPLKGMPLTHLRTGTGVTDLEPLKGMKLTYLVIDGPITDLSAVEGMPLESLSLLATKVSDLTPLRGMKLIEIGFVPKSISKGMDVLRQMTSLKTIHRVDVGINIPPDEFWKRYDAGEFAERITDFNAPAFQQWVKEVQALPAEQQVEAVSKKLVELNPGFDGTLTGGGGSASIQNGVVTSLGIVTDNVTDLSPVRAFSALDVLDVRGSSQGGGKLRDLSPLKGMRLISVFCSNNPTLSDLSSLKDLPLKSLDCPDTGVADLTPISGMKLNSLNVGGTNVMDLSPIKGMPLEQLLFSSTKVTDLVPLQGLQLRTLQMGSLTTSDLSPLKGMPLTNLTTGNGVTDLEPLRGMKLTFLCFAGPVTDLSPLEGMPLTQIDFGPTKVSDLSPLKGMKLWSLRFAGPVADLSPVEGMPLTDFTCRHTNVSDLSPLKGMKLTQLVINSSPVSDLSAVEGMPLEYLELLETKVSDLSPLRGMKLTQIGFVPKTVSKGMDVLRQMTSLKTINIAGGMGFPSEEFWKRYDAGEFAERITDFNAPAFQQWVKEVQALPAEQQVEAVSKKLVELNPGFDGELKAGQWGDGSPRIENGVVTEAGLFTDNVTDISPVRAFAGLNNLYIQGSSVGRGKLRDLSPLNRMRLTTVSCRCNPELSDLSPLKDLPLTYLDCSSTRVSDLSPISAMKLSDLCLTGTNVIDLSPLKGMPLENLIFQNTQVSDLSPLQGLQLRTLIMSNVPATDLTPLKGLPLTYLTTGNGVTDLEPLRGMKLTNLVFFGPVTDLSPLEGMPLTGLNCGGTEVSDLSPLKGMKLSMLVFGGPVSDLSGVEGMPLETLELNHTKVSDLSLLRGMKLKHLSIISSPVSDLSVIEGMPLEHVVLSDTKVSDLSPLRGMKLTWVAFTPKIITKGIDVLRQMNTITSIGVVPWDVKSPDEFWKKYDAGEFDEPKPQ